MDNNKIWFGLVFGMGLLLVSFSALCQNFDANYLLVINTYNQKGAPEKALEYYNKNKLQLKTNSATQLGLGTTYYLLGDYKQAANIFITINSNNNRKANYELAQCYAQLNKPELAVKYLSSHLESKNRFMRRTIKSDEAFAAIENSDEWIELWGNEWYSKYDLMLEDAWYEYEHENFEEALNIIDKLNSIRKSLVKAYYLKALVYISIGEPQNALVSINTAIEKRDKVPKYYAIRAVVEIEVNKPKKALKSIAVAIKMDSVQIDYYFTRAKAYLKSGKLEMATNDLQAMVSLIPDFDVYKLAGEIYSQGGEYQSALKAYNKCIAIQKYNAEIYIARADVYKEIYAYEFAEKDYTMALDFYPVNGELYYKRGIVRKLQHKSGLACTDFHKAFNYKYMKADDEIRGYCQNR